MAEHPKVSVLMPVYNAERYLAKALNSILNQTFTDFEVVVINDGSTDSSERILLQFEHLDHRIRLFSRPNLGLVDTLNEGLEYVKGQYIARIDADDIALPTLFEKQVVFLDSHKDYVAVGELVLMIDQDDDPIRVTNQNSDHEEIDRMHLMGFGAFPHSGSMIRREAIQQIGGYRKQFNHAEDIDLWLRLAEVGRLQNLPEVLLKYRLHPKSIGHTRRKEQIEATRKLILDACNRRKLPKPESLYAENEEQPSMTSIYRRWAWWALEGKNIKTARKYAFRAFLRQPFSLKSWRLLFCSLRGW